MKYCAWLQQKIQLSNPGFEVTVTLPVMHEWTWAAMGGRSQAMYPWANWYLRNKKGEYLCNFKRVGDQAIYRDPKTGRPVISEPGISTADLFTANVRSYYPNDYGLYNMSGNAAEMIMEEGICMGGSWNDYGGDVTTRSMAGYTGSAPTVGFRPVIKIKEKTSN